MVVWDGFCLMFENLFLRAENSDKNSSKYLENKVSFRFVLHDLQVDTHVVKLNFYFTIKSSQYLFYLIKINK